MRSPIRCYSYALRGENEDAAGPPATAGEMNNLAVAHQLRAGQVHQGAARRMRGGQRPITGSAATSSTPAPLRRPLCSYETAAWGGAAGDRCA